MRRKKEKEKKKKKKRRQKREEKGRNKNGDGLFASDGTQAGCLKEVSDQIKDIQSMYFAGERWDGKVACWFDITKMDWIKYHKYSWNIC